MLIAGVSAIAWLLITAFLWEARWRGRLAILAIVVPSIFLHHLGDGDTTHLYWALGFALRVGVAVVYLIWRQLPVLSRD